MVKDEQIEQSDLQGEHVEPVIKVPSGHFARHYWLYEYGKVALQAKHTDPN